MGMGGNNGPLVLDSHPHDGRVGFSGDGNIQTLSGQMGTGGNNTPLLMEPRDGSRTAAPIANKATRYKGGGETRKDDGAGNGLGIGEPGDPSYTLTAGDRHGVAYGIDRAAFNQGVNAKYDFAVEEELQPTMTARGPAAVGTYAMQGFGDYKESDKASSLKTRDCKDSTDLIAGGAGKYVIRRLTPLECCRLQGFPDGWTDDLAAENPSAAELKFWTRVWAEHWALVDRADGVKSPKDEKAVRRWLKNPASDSALYKMWGNGLALPCAQMVMDGIAAAMEKEVV